MLCCACHTNKASHRVTERLAGGEFFEAHYCEACCKSKAGLPAPSPKGLYTLVDRESRQSRVVEFVELIKLFAPPT